MTNDEREAIDMYLDGRSVDDDKLRGAVLSMKAALVIAQLANVEWLDRYQDLDKRIARLEVTAL